MEAARRIEPARSTLGIIAGGGAVPLTVAAAAEAAGRPVCIFAIRGEADQGVEAYRHHWIRWGEIGRLFDLLAREKVGQLVIAGSVNRPDYRAIRVDLGAVFEPAPHSGADGRRRRHRVARCRPLLRGPRLSVVGAHEIAPTSWVPKACLAAVAPDERARLDIQRGFEAAAMLGRLDIGQAVVAIGGRVVAVEGVEGTDELLQRVADLRARGRIKAAAREGVLVKAPSAAGSQGRHVPTIGPRTLALGDGGGPRGHRRRGRTGHDRRSGRRGGEADQRKLFIVGERLVGTDGPAP